MYLQPNGVAPERISSSEGPVTYAEMKECSLQHVVFRSDYKGQERWVLVLGIRESTFQYLSCRKGTHYIHM